MYHSSLKSIRPRLITSGSVLIEGSTDSWAESGRVAPVLARFTMSGGNVGSWPLGGIYLSWRCSIEDDPTELMAALWPALELAFNDGYTVVEQSYGVLHGEAIEPSDVVTIIAESEEALAGIWTVVPALLGVVLDDEALVTGFGDPQPISAAPNAREAFATAPIPHVRYAISCRTCWGVSELVRGVSSMAVRIGTDNPLVREALEELLRQIASTEGLYAACTAIGVTNRTACFHMCHPPEVGILPYAPFQFVSQHPSLRGRIESLHRFGNPVITCPDADWWIKTYGEMGTTYLPDERPARDDGASWFEGLLALARPR